MQVVRFAGAIAFALVSVTLVSAEAVRAPSEAVQPRSASTARLAALPASDGHDATTAVQNAVAVVPASAPASDAGADHEGPRLALVIGNTTYADSDRPLATPVNDARALAQELRGRGFDVELGEDLSKPAMERAIARFEAKIQPGATALLFFSGHGVQIGRESFLLPVSAHVWRPEDVGRDGIALEPLVAEMNARGATHKLVVVDASRRNPFERRLRGLSIGLAPIVGPAGTLVLYAVAPGKVVDDQPGETSVFARTLIEQIRAPGASAEDAFNRTRVAVAHATNGDQVPAVFSALVDDFRFDRPTAAVPTRQSAR